MQSITVKCKEIRARNANIVVEGENRAEVVEFTVMDAASIEGLSDMSFYVQYRNRLGEVGMDVLEKDVIGDTVVLDWLPSASFTKERGPVEIQIIGFTQSLVTTSDSTYQSGKLYFDADGEFIPVYPAGSTSSPKVGDSITGTVKEMEETGDDHRWSTMKALLFLPEDVFEGGTPVYTEAQVNALITQIQGEMDLARGYAEAAASSASDASDSEDAAEGSASDAYDSALISEGYAVGTQMGVDVGSGSIYYENNAKHYSEEASDSATAASASAGAASTSATIADNARIASVTETVSPDDGGTNVITFTYKDGTTKTFTVKNGKTGSPFEIYKTYASIAAMNADFANVPLMKMVCISSNTQDPDNGKLYVRGEEQFEYITDMSGAQGIQGPSGTITVGTVTSGATASVTNTGTSTDAVFDFVLPKGDKGDTATIAIGTVTAGDDPSDASVTNVGTSTDAVLDFVLPKGDKGDTGATPLLSIGEVTYGDTPDVTIDVTDPENPVLDFVLKTSEVGVVDNLSSSSSVDALSARMGKDLQSQIINLNSQVETLDAIVGCEAEIDNVDPSEGQSILSSSRLIHHVNLLPSGEFGLVGARDIVHEGSIVNLNPTGFSIRGINLWDEDWEVGDISDVTGEKSPTSDRIRSKNYIPVSPSTEYWFLVPTGNGRLFYYDINKNFISAGAWGVNTYRTTPPSCAYVLFTTNATYGTTYNHDIQICDNSIPSAVKTVYHPYSEQTVPVSISGHYVNENAYDYVTNKTVDGVLRGEVHTRVGVVDLGTLTWTISDNGNYFYADLPTSSVTGSFALCAKYVNVSSGQAMYTGTEDKVVGVALNYISGRTDRVYIRDSAYADATTFEASLSGVTLLYELATESVTYGEPLRSFSVSDYCTIEPITPQTLPNRVDVPFSILSKSNNGLIEQIRTNTADIADNKAILSQHEARLSNLEQISGEYVTSDMQDYSTVPTGKASYALVETMKGVSRVENQLISTTDFPTATRQGVTFTNNGDGTITADSSGSPATGYAYTSYAPTLVVGHSYLLFGSARQSNCGMSVTAPPVYDTGDGVVFSANIANPTIYIYVQTGETVSNLVYRPNLVDLTLYFNGGTIPTLAEIQQYHPQLLEPRAYNEGEIVDSTYTKVTSVGANRLNPTEFKNRLVELGGTDNEDGTVTIQASALQGNTIWENTTGESVLSVRLTGTNSADYANLLIIYTDGTDTTLRITSSGTWITSTSGKTVKSIVGMWATGSTTFVVAQCGIFIGATSTWSDYMTTTLTIPSVTLKGAGSVSDTLDVESGEITRNVGSIVLDGSLDENYGIYGSSYDGFAITINGMSIDAINPSTQLVSDVFLANTVRGVSGTGLLLKTWSSTDAYSAIFLCGTGETTVEGLRTWLASHVTTINYNLATPTTESVTPTLDNTLKTEGGGSVHSDADVDGQFTMGFINL